MLHKKIAVLAVFALFFGLVGSASAHTHQVVGNYEVEVGWQSEPPTVGKENAITVMITPAPVDETTVDDMADEEIPDNSNQTMTESEHDEMADDAMAESEHDDEAEHDEEGGITGLASVLEVSITVDDEKTDLTLIEDDETPGLYIGKYTPTKVGQPLVHVFGTINEDTVEVTFHPEEIESVHATPIQQQNDGVEPRDVVCPDDLVLLGKKTSGIAVCVTQKTADLLLARDWAFHFE